MIWIAAGVMAFVFIKLGMLIVMVKLLEILLSLALLAFFGFTLVFIWRRLFRPSSSGANESGQARFLSRW